VRPQVNEQELPVADVLPFTLPGAVRAAPVIPVAPVMSATAPKYEQPVPFAMPDWQQQMGVVMTRVTESITVPVSTQAQLPQALMAEQFFARETGERAAAQQQAGPVNLKAHDPIKDGLAEADDWSVADSALIKKYASEPGE
jgi:hypothetical protein